MIECDAEIGPVFGSGLFLPQTASPEAQGCIGDGTDRLSHGGFGELKAAETWAIVALMEGKTMMVVFDKQGDLEAERRLAQFISELIRQGVRFSVRSDAFSYEVTLTGGY